MGLATKLLNVLLFKPSVNHQDERVVRDLPSQSVGGMPCLAATSRKNIPTLLGDLPNLCASFVLLGRESTTAACEEAGEGMKTVPTSLCFLRKVDLSS